MFKNLELPLEYIENYIYQYVGYVKRINQTVLNGCCPICHEGKSWGKKKRFFYDSNRENEGNTVKCHNCGYVNTSLGFIKDVSGLSLIEIEAECQEYDLIPRNCDMCINTQLAEIVKPLTLPRDSINLNDPLQLDFYSSNPVVKEALRYIKTRKLDTACNRPKTFYLSLTDYAHRNRLIIPYYEDDKILWYQTRKLGDEDTPEKTRKILENDSPKYLSKGGGTRPLFNIDNICADIPYIFVTEGAFDSMFIKNGTCVSGITESNDFLFTQKQKEQLVRFPLHKIVWVLDSPYLDETARSKIDYLIGKGELVFRWPKALGSKYKDINDIVMSNDIENISTEFILQHSLNNNKMYDDVKYFLGNRK